MAFLETPRLDDCFAFGITGGPAFNTAIAILDSGFEYANQNWAQARRRYTARYNAKKPEAFDELLAFFMAVGGMANQFRVKDPFDFSVTLEQGVVSPLGGGLYQMYKRYQRGSFIHNRKIQKPVSPVTVVGGGTVDYTTGIISAGSPTAWSGPFDVPCRFDTDMFTAVAINRNLAAGLLVDWDDVDIIEVRLA